MYKLLQGDCIELMKKIPDKSINMVLCDLPYSMTSMKWDCLIPFDELWEQYKRIIKDDGIIVLFSAGLFTIDLIESNRKMFKYRLIWKKNVPTGMSSAKYRPMKYYEEICVLDEDEWKYCCNDANAYPAFWETRDKSSAASFFGTENEAFLSMKQESEYILHFDRERNNCVR